MWDRESEEQWRASENFDQSKKSVKEKKLKKEEVENLT